MSAPKLVALTVCAVLLSACVTATTPPGPHATFPRTTTPFVPTNEFTPVSAEDQVRGMGRGVNVLGYDPIWRDPAQARFHVRHIQIIHNGGFQTIRINLQAFRHMASDNTLDPRWFATLDRMVHAALAAHLNVILDDHDSDPCSRNPDSCAVVLGAFWRQVATHYQNAPNTVMFELLNEPNRALDARWNDVAAQVLAIVRETNPERNVVIGPSFWNSLDHLGELQLPENDRHIIVTFHYYQPMEFTHQGASWVPEMTRLGVTWGTDAERAVLKANFDTVAAWSAAHHRPILLGEFGAYDRGPLDSRVAYTSAVAREAEAHGFPWCYWQFDSDFVVWDMAKNAWNAPIHDALIPR